MTFTPVNTCTTSCSAVTAADALQHDGPSSPPPESASKYRSQVVVAAEKVAEGLPRRKRKSSAIKANTSIKRSKAKQSSTKQPPIIPNVSKRSKRHLRSDKMCKENDLADDRNSNASIGDHTDRDVGMDIIAEDIRGPALQSVETSIPVLDNMPDIESHAEASSVDNDQGATNHPHHSNSSPTVIEISSDHSDSFEDIDESIFDELHHAAASPNSCLSQSNSSLTGTTTSESPTNERKELCARTSARPADQASLPTFPNGAPFPPFMHPGLLNSSLAAFMDKQRSSSLTPLNVCFRIGEALRVRSVFEGHISKQHQETMFETFSTIHDVRYGQQQEVVFSDCFFPDRPPYITAISKSPYVPRDLLDSSHVKGTAKRVMKATIKMSTFPQISSLRKSTQTAYTESVGSSGANTDLEILDLRGSS